MKAKKFKKNAEKLKNKKETFKRNQIKAKNAEKLKSNTKKFKNMLKSY